MASDTATAEPKEMLTTAEQEFSEVRGDEAPETQVPETEFFLDDPDPVKPKVEEADTPSDDTTGDDDAAGETDEAQTTADDDAREETKVSAEPFSPQPSGSPASDFWSLCQ